MIRGPTNPYYSIVSNQRCYAYDKHSDPSIVITGNGVNYSTLAGWECHVKPLNSSNKLPRKAHQIHVDSAGDPYVLNDKGMIYKYSSSAWTK